MMNVLNRLYMFYEELDHIFFNPAVVLTLGSHFEPAASNMMLNVRGQATPSGIKVGVLSRKWAMIHSAPTFLVPG